MTMSSAQLYPKRVEPIMRVALERVPIRQAALPPPPRNVQRARCNLFCTSERDRAETNRLFQEENQKNRSYVKQRYIPLPTSNSDATTRILTTNLIVLERLQEERRLRRLAELAAARTSLTIVDDDDDAERRIQQIAEVTPPPPQQIRRTASIIHATPLGGGAGGVDADPNATNERPKPYARQTLLTESFCVRKSAQLHKVAGAAATRRPVEVLEMPQPILAAELAPAAAAVVAAAAEVAETEDVAAAAAAATSPDCVKTITTSAASAAKTRMDVTTAIGTRDVVVPLQA